MKNEVFHGKNHNGDYQYGNDGAEKMPPEFFDMLEEAHFIWVLNRCFFGHPSIRVAGQGANIVKSGLIRHRIRR